MWEYTDKVMEYFYNPRNQGAITEKEDGQAITTGEVGSIACGDALRLHLKVDEETDIILDARFQTFGCTSAISSSSALTELIIGKTLDEALKLTNKEIADFLGGLPEEKMHCSVMGQEALEAAIFNYRGIPLDNHEDDEGALICKCFGVTDARIRRVILENDLTTAEQVTHYVKAGGGCSSCLADIDDLIAEVAAQKAQTVAMANSVTHPSRSGSTVSTRTSHGAPAGGAPVSSAVGTRPLTNLQKITLIQQILENEVKPVLAEDGGDVELFDVSGNLVQVILKGACGSCSSSTVTLKMAIEARLRDQISPDIIVESI